MRTEATKEFDDCYKALEEAYEIAGGLRDRFTGVQEDRIRGHLKDHCNEIRQSISNLRYKAGLVRKMIQILPKP